MALYPHAIQKPIPPGANDPKIVPIGIILHVRAGEGDSLHGYFDGPSGGIESHGYIRYSGVSEQYRDTEYEADANYLGNSFVRNGVRYGFISLETEGYGDGLWTREQIAEIKRWIVWAADEHEHIVIRVCPEWDEAGIGYHIQFGAPGAWTDVAKVCPGFGRIRQFNNELVPWMAAGADLEDDVVTEADKNDIARRVVHQMQRSPGLARQIARWVWDFPINGKDGALSYRNDLLRRMGNRVRLVLDVPILRTSSGIETRVRTSDGGRYSYRGVVQTQEANAKLDAILDMLAEQQGLARAELDQRVEQRTTAAMAVLADEEPIEGELVPPADETGEARVEMPPEEDSEGSS